MKRLILITGSRKGIGKELAKYYLNLGFIVVGCSRGASSISKSNYHHYELDVADEKAVVNMVKNVANKFKKIDVLINNAGIASMNHLALTPAAVVQNVFQTNFLGSFLFIREVSKIMMRHKSGRIVNFSTVAVPLLLDGEAVYASSKAAIEELTKISAKELGAFKITVNAIAPTPIKTDLIKNVPKNKIADLLKKQALPRFGGLRDIKNVIDFFINENSDFVTGQILYLGGVNH